jgi:hypothetical protein
MLHLANFRLGNVTFLYMIISPTWHFTTISFSLQSIWRKHYHYLSNCNLTLPIACIVFNRTRQPTQLIIKASYILYTVHYLQWKHAWLWSFQAHRRRWVCALFVCNNTSFNSGFKWKNHVSLLSDLNVISHSVVRTINLNIIPVYLYFKNNKDKPIFNIEHGVTWKSI